jgi:TolB-like protein/Tfp pilus assembly protein PilF
MSDPRRQLGFGGYRLEPATGRLWSGEREIHLTPKASAVLVALVSRAGQPVTKDELFATVWNGTPVTDDALGSCVRELRKALGDDAKCPRFIETRHRRGYRFAAPVTDAGERRGPVASESAGRAQGPAGPITAIAVLPFADMSPRRDQDYLCEGLAEELINALTHVQGLRVAARSSSFQFRGPGVDVRAAGRELDVAALLEGSVRKSDDRLRITVQLIDVGNGYHRWSRRFDRKLDDVFAIQDEIATAVALELRGASLSRRERDALHRPETAADAYECYLRGRQHLHRLRRSDLEGGRELFERAIDLDPGYAPAWAGLASVHAVLYEWFGARDEDLERADTASQRALAFAEDLADSHVARGLVLSLTGRYREAAGEFDEAIRINPNLFDAYYYYARACFACGEIERSAELFRKAGEVRREDFQSMILLGQCLRMLDRPEEANEANREGIARAERTLALNPQDSRALSLGSTALAENGDLERSLEWSRRVLELYPDDMSALINGACARVRAGLETEALDLLERAFARGWGKRDWIEHDPDYDSLRGEPRFQALLANLK